jgi:glycosyltransferase involved in cell wall biosynthesis
MDEGLKHQIIIIGDGFDFENIHAKLNQLGLQDTVKMLGFRSNPIPTLKHRIFM